MGATNGKFLNFSTLSNSSSINFGSILAAASEDQTMALTGAVIGDVVMTGLPSDQDANLIIEAFVSAVDTITFRAHNVGAVTVDQAAKTYKATIIR